MNDPNETIDQVVDEIQHMGREKKDNLLLSLNAGNITKQKYIEGLEDYIQKLKARIKELEK